MSLTEGTVWHAHVVCSKRAHDLTTVRRAQTALYRCWLDRVPYVPTQHGAAKQLELTLDHELAA
jgi:hypothetical protein